MLAEIHLFIIWSNATDKLHDILDDIKLYMNIKRIYTIQWSKEKFSENLSRFYGQNLPNGSDKEIHCGTDEFICIIVEDIAPKYQTRVTSRGLELVNINMFDLKLKYRNWTGGGHKIHATNNILESEHDLSLLFGKHYDFFKNVTSDAVNFNNFNQDIVGANGWESIEKLFDYLNRFTKYIVMRNFECLFDEYTMAEHGDIDLLVENLDEVIYLTNAKKVFLEPYRVHYRIVIDGEEVLFDFRYVGDDYYDEKFARLLLQERVLDSKGFYRPNDRLYFVSLLYHALVHKPIFSQDYQQRLKVLANNINVNDVLLSYDPVLLLIDQMDEYQFKLVKPKDLSVYYNQSVVNKFVMYENLLEVCRTEDDYEKILLHDNRWLILKNLSPIRQNILNWYPFKKDSTLLEIGGGCGAITGLLCKRVQTVKVVELSKRRSIINFERNREYDNLEIIVGNLNDIKLDHKFDYVTLIGVLEYAGSFTKTKEPYKEFLKNIKSYLNEDGKLLLAIENRFGLKYFAGAKEDHTGKEFDSITGYVGNDTVRTFGKLELEHLLKSAGFESLKFYYPHPDYKMPFEMYSDDYLPSSEEMLMSAPNFDNERYELFSEPLAFKGIIENGQFPFFANSFFIECSIK